MDALSIDPPAEGLSLSSKWGLPYESIRISNAEKEAGDLLEEKQNKVNREKARYFLQKVSGCAKDAIRLCDEAGVKAAAEVYEKVLEALGRDAALALSEEQREMHKEICAIIHKEARA